MGAREAIGSQWESRGAEGAKEAKRNEGCQESLGKPLQGVPGRPLNATQQLSSTIPQAPL